MLLAICTQRSGAPIPYPLMHRWFNLCIVQGLGLNLNKYLYFPFLSDTRLVCLTLLAQLLQPALAPHPLDSPNALLHLGTHLQVSRARVSSRPCLPFADLV